MDKNKRDKKKRGKESTSGGEKSTSQSVTASSSQPTEPNSQPVQPTPGEKPVNPLMAKIFPMCPNRTPDLAQILAVRGRCPGTEDSSDPLKIAPDVMDMIMGWNIDDIFANSKHVRMPYTRNFPTENSTLESPRVAEELSPVHEFKEFKPRSMQETDANATSGSKGKGKGKKSKAVQDQPSGPVTKPEEIITQQAAATPPQVEELDLSSKISPDDVYSVAPYNRPNRQSNSKGCRGRGENYTPRATYPRPPGIKTQYPPLPPPQRPYVPQRNQWPSLGAPRQPYQSRNNFQDNIKLGQHQGKPSSRGRGKTVFKKFSRNLEPMEPIDEAAPPADGLDVKPRIEEEKPKEGKPKEEKPKEEIVPKGKVEIPKQPEKCRLHKEVQANAAQEETVRGGYTSEEPIAINRYYRNEKSRYYRRNTSETSTRREELSMQQNVAAAIEQLHLEQSQNQHQPSRKTSNPGYVGQPATKGQPVYYSPVFPGYVPYFEQSQQATPSQSQTPTSTPGTSQEDSTHQDKNQQTPLTREQYEMQAQYQQFFNQQRQLFYQMRHQQQQQFMYMQMQQMQQQQSSQQSKSSQKQQASQQQQKHQTSQHQHKHSSQRHQQRQMSQQHQRHSSQHQQQQIYYQQRPTWHQDVPPPTMPVVQGFVPASYQVPPPTQYRLSSRHRHREAGAEAAASAEVPAARGDTNEQPPRPSKKTKKPKTRTTITQVFPHVPQGTMQYIRPNTLSSIASQASIRNIPMPASVLESYRRPPEPTVIEEVQPEPSTPRELTEEEIFKRDNPLAYELSKLPQRFGVVPQVCSNSSDSSSDDSTYW